MESPLVCILTSGRGTRMGAYSDYINKALLPYKKKALISHIIESFPANTRFVISLGFLGQQVVDYLKIAHPQTQFVFQEISNYDGAGSGPGRSLLECKPHLNKPFFFVSCDTLWSKTIPWNEKQSWAGVAPVPQSIADRYCNLLQKDHAVFEIADKKTPELGISSVAFSGLLYVSEIDVFWQGLGKPDLISGEHQISSGLQALVDQRLLKTVEIDWLDLGDLTQYQNAIAETENFDFSKTDEFIYQVGGQVIKFFRDSKITEKRVKRAEINPAVFPKITRHSNSFYAYSFVPGETLYHYCSEYLFSELLQWLKTHLWKATQSKEEETKFSAAATPSTLKKLTKEFKNT